MNLLRSKDPAPSRLSYKINRLFYRLWFKMLLMTVLFFSSTLLAKKFLYNNIDVSAELRFLSEESSALFKGLTKLSINKIVVEGAQEPLKKEITLLVKDATSEGFPALKAQALRDKIQSINKVEKAFVKFSTDGVAVVSVLERKAAVVFFNNELYQVLDSNGVILSINSNYEGLSKYPLLVGKDGSKNIGKLMSLVKGIGPYTSEVLYYEWVGERRWNVHMKNDLVVKLPENNLSKGLELMQMFLRDTNSLLKTIVSIDLRNIDRPIVKFKKALNFNRVSKKTGRIKG